MKRFVRVLCILLIILLVIIWMSGCAVSNADSTAPCEPTEMTCVPVNLYVNEGLVYDVNTNIVYINQRTYQGSRVYTLYLSPNGLPYKYIDGELVEIEYHESEVIDNGY